MPTTIATLLGPAVERLRASGSGSARLDAELLLAHALGAGRTVVLAHPDAPVGPDAAARFEAAVGRREAGEPVAYIRGIREFYGLALGCDARALVPRPETEVLVELAIADVVDRLGAGPRPPGTPPIAVADVGTGSGAIAVALGATLRRQGMGGDVAIIASDCSPDACDLARENAVAHGLADRLGVTVADLLPPPRAAAGLLVVPGRFDVVAANLPYIRTGDLDGLAPDLGFEPRESLDGGTDGLAVIRALLAALPDRLAPGGRCFLEIGSDQDSAIVAAVEAILPGWQCAVEPDLSGLPRVAVVEQAA